MSKEQQAIYALSNGNTLEEQKNLDGDVFGFNYLVWRSEMLLLFIQEKDDEFHDWLVATVARDRR